jgi:hypothetical protein
LFFKTGHWERMNKDYEGFGGDIKYSLNQTLNLYAGYSIRDEIWTNEQVPSFETGIQIKYSSLLLDLKYAGNEYYNYLYWQGGPEFYKEIEGTIKSVGINFNLDVFIGN